MINAAFHSSSVLLALAPASAGAGAAATPLALTATPAHAMLAGNARTAIRLTNSGTRRLAVDVSRAGFGLDLRGRPRIVQRGGARSATRWLTVRPGRLTIGPHSSASLVVAARVPPHAEPGDHDALVLLSTRPLAKARVAVRLRIGIVVVVRAPGKLVRQLELRDLRAAGHAMRQALDLVVVNRGNVTESLTHPRAVVSRSSGSTPLTAATATSRELRPRTSGVVEFRLRRRLRGWVTVRVVIPAEPGRSVLRRTYRLRL